MSSWCSALNECFVAVIYYGEKQIILLLMFSASVCVCVCDAHISDLTFDPWYSDWKTVCHGNRLEHLSQSDGGSALTLPLTSGFPHLRHPAVSFVLLFFQCLFVKPWYTVVQMKSVWLDYILCCFQCYNQDFYFVFFFLYYFFSDTFCDLSVLKGTVLPPIMRIVIIDSP